ncbi:unnamed protein product, partial [Amoebophrya sp. A25]|eukprot:GSA25T00025864001.1
MLFVFLAEVRKATTTTLIDNQEKTFKQQSIVLLLGDDNQMAQELYNLYLSVLPTDAFNLPQNLVPPTHASQTYFREAGIFPFLNITSMQPSTVTPAIVTGTLTSVKEAQDTVVLWV